MQKSWKYRNVIAPCYRDGASAVSMLVPAVSWSSEQRRDLAPEAPRRPDVLAHSPPFVEGDDQRVLRGQAMARESEPQGFVVGRPREGSEQAIPHDQHTAEVPVEAACVRCVVDAVVSWRVEHPFERS